MKNSKKINHTLLNKKVLVYCTGLEVEATITNVSLTNEGERTERIEFRYKHRPIQWGDEFFTTGWFALNTHYDKTVRGKFEHTNGTQITYDEIVNGIIK